MTGAELISAERQRQIEKEGWTPEHDDAHENCDLASAAESYILASSYACDREDLTAVEIASRMKRRPPRFWPWDRSWWKPSGDPIRDLTKAGALIAAEIDRLQRKEASRSGS